MPSLASSFHFRAALALTLCAVALARAQYPSITPEVKREADRRMTESNAHSDAAWAAAQPALREWAIQGKPFLPGARRPADLPQAPIPSFPGAQGGGMFSFGGRGGKVFVVTNLNDRGPGSFREALEAGGPRIVVFNVAGIIRLKEKIRIRAPYITIAGSTAPGDGVCIAGDTVELETHDVVIRHLRFRRGETWVGDRNDSIGGNPIGNVMIDHVSASWGLDENMSMYRHMHRQAQGPELKLPTVNITIQHSIFSECLNTYSHSFGSTIGGYNSTFHHNLWANNAGRNPSIGMIYDFTFVNNVLFNWAHRTVDGGDHRSFYTIVNNYLKPGPATPAGANVGFRFLKPESDRDRTKIDNFGQAYVAGNVAEGNERVSRDNWDGGVQPEPQKASRADVLAKVRSAQPYPHAFVEIQSAQEAYASVLANSGATLPRRDAVDERIVANVRTGKVSARKTGTESADLSHAGYKQNTIDAITGLVEKGIISDIRQVGGYPDYKGTPYVDTDGDGMSDTWESAHGLNPKNAADAATDLNGDGYTNIEEFINGLDPRAPKRDWTNAPRTFVDRFGDTKL